MIAYLPDAQNSFVVSQWHTDPAVYLDHCMLRKISESPELSSKFVKALKRRNGTLYLSFVNVLEFSKMSDRDQGRMAEQFIADCVPNLFFINSNPFQVSQRELDLHHEVGPKRPPHADVELFEAFQMLEPAHFELFPTTGFLSTVQETTLSARFSELTKTIVERLNLMRNEAQLDAELANAIKRSPRGLKMQRNTKTTLLELAGAMLRNGDMKFTHQHASDLLHAVVPLTYADFIFLDRSWADRARKSILRIREAGFTSSFAEVYSARPGEIEQFFKRWEE